MLTEMMRFMGMDLTARQKQIIKIVKAEEPISGDQIAQQLGLTKSTLRSDFAVLTMIGVLDARPKVGYIYSGLDFEPLLQERLTDLTVADVMVAPVIVKQDITIADAVTNLFMYDAGSLYAVNDAEELVGVVSRKDLLRSLLMGHSHDAVVALVMTRMPNNIFVVHPDTPILLAAKIIARHEIDSVPVVREDNEKLVVGKISKTVLVNLFIELGDKAK